MFLEGTQISGQWEITSFPEMVALIVSVTSGSTFPPIQVYALGFLRSQTTAKLTNAVVLDEVGTFNI